MYLQDKRCCGVCRATMPIRSCQCCQQQDKCQGTHYTADVYINAACAKQRPCLGSEPSWLPKMRSADTLENRHDSMKRYQVVARAIDDNQAVIITTNKISTARTSKMSQIRMMGFMGQVVGHGQRKLNSLNLSWNVVVVILQIEC